MTQEGLENLKKVMRKAIELQADAAVVMSVLQSIYCDEEYGLDQDAEEHLRSATVSARGGLDYAMATLNEIQKAYGIEKSLSELVSELDKRRDNDEARAREAQGASN